MRKALFISLLSMLACWAWGQGYSYRYWIDDNVGSAVSGSASGETQFTINTAQLASGLHAIHVQGKGSGSEWSSVQTRYFLAEKATSMTAASARYWLDSDLSTMHNGVATSGTIDIDITGLKVGIHAVHYQKIATDGTPSSAQTRYFLVYAPTGMTATSARYWIDNDLSTMHNGVTTSGVINIDISKLGIGLHCVHYQKIAADGTPSAAQTRYFYVDRAQAGGYKAAISIDDGEATLYDITDEDIVIDLGDLKGDHVLHVVIYDEQNRVVDEQTHTFAAAPLEVKTVELTQAGTLADFITAAEKSALKELTIIGPLNSTDFKLLREMAGNNSLGEPTDGKLEKLDLSGATIVTGGENYMNELAIEKDNELGQEVFRGCKLKEIVIPASVTSIANRAFEGCTELTSVISYIKKPFDINRNCFCLTLDGDFTSATLTVPYNTKASYQQADGWKYFTKIVEMSAADTNIDFADNAVKTICVEQWDTSGDGELSYAEAAEVTTLGTAFKGTGIVTFDELEYFTGLKRIDNSAFQGCTNLTSVAMPSGTTAIGQQAFARCTSLSAIVIPATVQEIGSGAFQGCTCLVSVTAHMATPPAIDSATFTNRANAILYVTEETKPLYAAADYWKEFGRVTYDGEPEPVPVIEFADATAKAICLEYWDVNGDGELDVEEAAAVTTIGDVFQQTDITSLDELRYFTGLTSIDDYAFALCSKLTSLVIPSGVENVGEALFYYCDALTSVTVDEANTVLDSRDGCNAIIETATNTLLSGCKTTVIPTGITAIADYAFYHIHGMTSLNIPGTVKSIGSLGFFGMMDVTSLTIPKSVESLGVEVIGNMDALKTLVVEDGNPVFDSREGCNAIIETATNQLVAACGTTVIPESVTSIGYLAYDVCPITSLYIPANVVSINDVAVRTCVNLATITVDAANKVYDSRGNCNAIMETATGKVLIGCKNTVIPESALSIGTYAFMDCEAMEEVTLPKSITAIGDYSFMGSISLTKVVAYMQTPPAIGEYTFTNRANADLYVPYGCKALYEAADYWKEFKSITEMEYVAPEVIEFADATAKAICLEYWDVNGDGELDTEEAAAATTIGNVFQQTAITSFDELRYFTGLTSIGSMAFALCQQLQSITIPSGVTTMGGGLFYYCDELTSVKVDEANPVLYSPDNCNAIIERASGTLLNGCKTTVIPANVTAIGDIAFYHIHGLTDLTLPQGLKSIGMGALFGLMDQVSLVIPKSVTSIGLEAIGNMNALESLVVEQGNSVFDSREGCNAIIETATNKLVAGCKTTDVPNSVVTIGSYAFDSCPLTELHIPASVTSIEELAVRLCSNLYTVTVETGNTVYDSHGNCNAIIEKATGRLLLGSLTTVIPVGTTSIGQYAFQGYERLQSIQIPSTVTVIGDNAFDGCDNLTSVIVGMQQPIDIAESTFTNRSNAVLYVPIGCKLLYAAAEYWKDFYDIKEIEITEGIKGDVNGDGIVNALDIQSVINAAAIESVEAKYDVNSDGKVNALDIQEVINISAATAARQLELEQMKLQAPKLKARSVRHNSKNME